MPARKSFKPRKTPRQTRSAATIEAIFEATLQILGAEGASRLTTTRVAERAGVSVGTLYQYFPNKEALLYAVLQKNLDALATAIETACRRLRGKSLVVMAEGVAAAYLAEKTNNVDATRALYVAASEIDTADLGREWYRRVFLALRTMLASAGNATFDDLDAVTYTLQQALAGTVRSVFESPNDAMTTSLAMLNTELPRLCRAYLVAASRRSKSA